MPDSSSTWLVKVSLFVSLFTLFASATDHHFSINTLFLDVSAPITLRLPTGSRVETNPASTTSPVFVCQRIYIQGLSRLYNLHKYAHTLKLKISNFGGDRVFLDHAEVCLHQNMSSGIGLCPQNQWEKLVLGAWVHSISPFDNKLLDIRTTNLSLEIFEVSIEEEFLLYRATLLALGVFLFVVSTFLSKSVAFYYGGAMAVSVILVTLMVLFQGMRMLPTGRKNSLTVVIYASLVGVGCFVVHYLPGLLRFLIRDDIYPQSIALLLILNTLTGARGFWMVRRNLLTEDGSVDYSVTLYSRWSIRIFSVLLIRQSSPDPLLATEAVVSAILLTSALNWTYIFAKRRQYRKSRMLARARRDSLFERPEGQIFTKEEWESFTRKLTKCELEELISSPDFTKWAVARAERITVGRHRKQKRSGKLLM